jgi:hypothetical protein
MADRSVEITLTARDNASAEVAKVNKSLAELGGQHKQVSDAAGTATETVRRFALSLRTDVTQAVSAFNPAAGSVVQSLGQVTRAGGALGLALGGTAAAVAVLVTGFTGWMQTSAEVARHQAELNIAVKSLDTSSVLSQLKAYGTELETLDVLSQGVFGRWRTGFRVLTDSVGQTVDAHERLRASVEALSRLAPFEQRLNLAQSGAARFGALANLAGTYLARAETRGDLGTFNEEYSQLLTNTLKRQGQEVAKLRAENEKAIAQLTATPEGISGPFLAQEIVSGADRLRALSLQHNAQIAAIDEARRRGVQGLEERRRFAAPEEAGLSLQAISPESRAVAAEAEDRIRASRVESLQLEQRGLELRVQAYGLTQAESAALAIQIALAKQRVDLEAAGGDERKQALADLEAAVKIEGVRLREFERLDPAAGLVRGIRDMAEEFGSLGLGMQQVARETASGMQRAFSDQFFSVVTGDFKNLPNVAKQFTQAMVRTITDELSRLTVGTFLNALRGAFSGGLGAVVPGLGGLATGGGGGGGGILTALLGSGTPGAGSIAGPSVGYGSPGGSFSLSNLPTPPVGSFGGGSLFSGTNLGAMWNAPIGALFSSDVVFSGGQLISNAGELAAAGIESAGVAGASSFAGAGLTLAGAFTGAAAGLGLGLTIYSALQGAPTIQNIAFSGAAGALSGAVLGATVGSIFPGIGTVVGGIVGAVAGGALGGGAAALGKGGAVKRQTPNERSAQAAQLAAGNLSVAIDAATTLEQLQQILNMKWSPYNEVNIVAYARAGTHWIGRWTNGPSPVLAIVKGNGESGPFFPDVSRMLSDPRYIDNLEIQVGAGGSAVYHQALTEKFQAKWWALLAAMAKAVFGFREQLSGGMNLLGPAPGGLAAVERFTTLSGDRLAEARGQHLEVSPDVLIRAGMSVDEVEQFLRLAVQVDKDRDLNIFIRPQEFGFA